MKAGNGRPGGPNNRTGHGGADLLIDVPLGTQVLLENIPTADLTHEGENARLLRGGRGGHGNAHFKSSTNQAPRRNDPGETGSEAELYLSVKLIADIGLVGFPNAGKSTLISRISNAHPRIAPYPFTTLEPNLGVVAIDDLHHCVVADIPGIIRGAHQGTGLGVRFLKHIERTRILLYILDGTDNSPFDDYQVLRDELGAYDRRLLEKPSLLAVNKDDLLDAEDREIICSFFPREPLFLSAQTGEGTDLLISRFKDLLNRDETVPL